MPQSTAAKWCEGTSGLQKLAGALGGALAGVVLETVVVGDGECPKPDWVAILSGEVGLCGVRQFAAQIDIRQFAG
jgi:hypothetical protein